MPLVARWWWAPLLVCALAGAVVPATVRASALESPGSRAPATAGLGAAPVPQDPAARLRAIVALIDDARERAAAPGVTDEERDALAELAWAQLDEALEDPALSGPAGRDPDFLQVRALLLMDDGEDGQALAALERLQALAPEDPETHRLLALCRMGLGNAAAAAESYRRALALGVPDAVDAAELRANLAYAIAADGRLPEGLAESDRAIAADPDGYLGHFVRGWILGESGRDEEGRGEYLRATAIERDDADLWSLLAESWERAGDAARAREAWREVVRIDPSDERAADRVAAPASGPAPTLVPNFPP